MAASSFSEFQAISIDFDVFKALTAQLESPEDTYNDVLRRLLELPAKPTPTQPRIDGRSWVVGGVTFPHGTEFRARYRGETYTARAEDGALVFDGQAFDTPSAAAAAITKGSVNGWLFWECRLPGRGWVTISSLRGK